MIGCIFKKHKTAGLQLSRDTEQAVWASCIAWGGTFNAVRQPVLALYINE